MVGAIVLSPTDAASQEAVVSSAQRVELARGLHVTQPYSIVSITSALSIRTLSSARSVVQFENVLPEDAPCVVYAPVDFGGQVDIVVDIPPDEVYELVHLLYTGQLPLC